MADFNIVYSKDEIERILNIINTMPFQGIDNALKISEIVKILQSPLVKAQQEKYENNNNSK